MCIHHINYQVPIINLSDFEINTNCLKYGFNHSFVDKNRFIKRDLHIELEPLASSIDTFVPQECKEKFDQFLRTTNYKLSNNVYHTKNSMYHKTKLIRENKDFVILSRDRDISIVIMNKKYYKSKIDNMINEGIQQKKFKETDDNVLKELQLFQSFFCQYFKNSSHYGQMLPSSHQPTCFFAIAKTHKFENINDITIDNLRLCPILDQTGTCYYKTGKVIAEYLKPLTKNELVSYN